LLHASPVLEALIRSETKATIVLTIAVVIEIHTASWRTTRGYTIVLFAGDECACWNADRTRARTQTAKF